MVQRQLPRPAEIFELVQFKKPELDAKRRRLEAALTIYDLRAIARRRTPKAAFDYTEGAAEEEILLAAPGRRSGTSSSAPRSCAAPPRSTPAARSSAAPRPCRSASPRPASPA